MPANLTPDYLEAERALKTAHTPDEKIAALERMLAALPKHKGTEKMQADLRRRLSQARKETQHKSGSRSAPAYIVKREGAGQIALAGPPNAGKSQLVRALTHAHPEVADYPFTTHMPVAGMMPFEDIQIQLVDLPAVSPHFTEPWLPQVLRTANAGVIVVDPAAPDVLDEIEWIAAQLGEWHVPPPKLLLANKLDVAGARAMFEELRELYAGRYRCLGVSAATGEGLAEFARAAFECLEVVRFYSKRPGKKPDLDVPYVLRRGETVADAAARVHRGIAAHLKYARLFHASEHLDGGRMVERAHAVADRDILAFHA